MAVSVTKVELLGERVSTSSQVGDKVWLRKTGSDGQIYNDPAYFINNSSSKYLAIVEPQEWTAHSEPLPDGSTLDYHTVTLEVPDIKENSIVDLALESMKNKAQVTAASEALIILSSDPDDITRIILRATGVVPSINLNLTILIRNGEVVEK